VSEHPTPLRSLLADGRRTLRRGLEAERLEPAAVGLALGREHARVLDRLLEAAFPAAAAAARCAGGVALAGVGGYGRGAVALGADLDVRILARDLAEAERLAEALLYPLWDSGLSVGHQVVTAPDLLEAARDDLPTATSLLDWRCVAGDRALSDELIAGARTGIFSPSELGRFLERLEREVEQRHGRFGGSVYLLEPDVKNGAGGLRDLDVARWAACARWSVHDFDELVRLGVLLPRQLEAVESARELLWRMRNLLHHRAGRRSDRLSFDDQEAIAPMLGYVEAGRADHDAALRDSVERMMSDYYRAARTVSRFRDLAMALAAPLLTRRRPSRRILEGGIEIFDGEATLASIEQLDREPATAFRLLRMAVAEGVPLRPSIRSALVSACGDAGWCERLRQSPEAARLFVELVSSCRETLLMRGTVRRELHDLGLLLAMIPEFQPVVGRVHHDTYHVYTVDVHSVAAVDRLAELVRGEVAGDGDEPARWAGSLPPLAAEITRPHVLFFATLLHDVGKAIGRRDHSERGAELCPVILGRLGFEARDIDAVARLVRHHLTMYHLATRRDLDDPATWEELAVVAGDREGLRDLYLLTVADLSTTSPTSMNSWKARMLDELYLATDRMMQGGSRAEPGLADDRRVETRALLRERGGVSDAFLDRYLDAMPARYLIGNAAGAILAHAALVEQHLAAGARGSVDLVGPEEEAAAPLGVVAGDRPGLLADITAVLAASRLTVLAAEIYSCPLERLGAGTGSLAIDVFWVQPSGGMGLRPQGMVAELLGRVRGDLDAVLDGRTDARELAWRGRRTPGRDREGPPVATRVLVDDRAAPGHTVVEVVARDRPGLLFALSHAIYSVGLSIALAKIATEGSRVVDVFYVTEQDGSKLGSERSEALSRALTAAVEGMKE
jgi:[protein-PII] uridylyltransferase